MDIAGAEVHEGNCHVALTTDHLDVKTIMDLVRDPGAGAIVLFAGEMTLRLSRLILS
jgi:molybdopterin synthase catalytic subunit